MNYDWKPLAPAHQESPAEHAAFLDKRVAEMSPMEWRIFRAAAELNPSKDLAGLIALSCSLLYAFVQTASPKNPNTASSF